MNLDVIDTAQLMREVVTAPPSTRPELIGNLWAPLKGMFAYFPGGADLAAAHAQNFGFPIDRDGIDAQLRDGIEALVAADAWARASRALEDAAEALTQANPHLNGPDIRVLLVLGDPTNEHFMTQIQGLSAFGGISGYIAITLWPQPRVLDRLEAIVAHELHHNLRYCPGAVLWDPATVTVGEQVVAEGLADVFAAELYGPAGYTHFVDQRTRTDNAILQKVASGLHITGMSEFSSWVLGDSTAALFGARPVGLPTGAGYAAGARIVEAYLAETGTTAARELCTPSAQILARALPRLGLDTAND